MNATSQFLTSGLQSFTCKDPWSDEVLALWVPIVAYWSYSTFFHFVMKANLAFFEQYRIHTIGDMEKRNKVSLSRVLSMVALQQVIQVILGFLVLHPVDPVRYVIEEENTLRWLSGLFLSVTNRLGMSFHLANILAKFVYWIIIPAIQFVSAMLYVPYAFGALYNHPVEGFLLDSLGAAIAIEVTRMSPKMSMIFFTFSTLKTVDDHCGYALPWDPLQFLFGNNVQYHDIHHQSYGIKKNFSQPFFTIWDKLLGTEMSIKEAEKRGGFKKTN
ncbi:hypothetical protein HPULCUR_009978 [Helicostylum pulchrum]|uniref:Fatty acid hydroxylase domain-containing protein n=1 Tax=Helicostylum pulchrum TaxID=562976 RepID=A0ABP9YC08_9FUNG